MHSPFRPAAPQPVVSCSRLVGLALLSTLAWVPVAEAALRDTISVELEAPDFHSPALTQAAPLATGVLAGNLGGSGDISSVMIDDERIVFVGDSILIHVGSGSDNGLTTGWGTDSRYVISGVSVVDAVITGYNVYAFDAFATSGSTGLADGLVASSFVAGSAGFSTFAFTIDDTLVFRDRGDGGAYNYADFRIDLLSQPVPEPSQWLLMGAGLAGLGLLGARRRAGQA